MRPVKLRRWNRWLGQERQVNVAMRNNIALHHQRDWTQRTTSTAKRTVSAEMSTLAVPDRDECDRPHESQKKGGKMEQMTISWAMTQHITGPFHAVALQGGSHEGGNQCVSVSPTDRSQLCQMNWGLPLRRDGISVVSSMNCNCWASQHCLAIGACRLTTTGGNPVRELYLLSLRSVLLTCASTMRQSTPRALLL